MLLLICLKAIYPHLGTPPLEIIGEANTIGIKNSVTMVTVYANMTHIQQIFRDCNKSTL